MKLGELYNDLIPHDSKVKKRFFKFFIGEYNVGWKTSGGVCFLRINNHTFLHIWDIFKGIPAVSFYL